MSPEQNDQADNSIHQLSGLCGQGQQQHIGEELVEEQILVGDCRFRIRSKPTLDSMQRFEVYSGTEMLR